MGGGSFILDVSLSGKCMRFSGTREEEEAQLWTSAPNVKGSGHYISSCCHIFFSLIIFKPSKRYERVTDKEEGILFFYVSVQI